jgi:ABC-2 type transport system ATP-binding protein
MYCLETIGLFHRYPNGDSALEDINLQVPRGSVYGFLGPNGAGKTTTLRLVLGLLKIQRGAISIFGKRFDAHRIEILRKLGALIETPSLYDHLTAAENLRVLQKIHRVPGSRIGEVLEQAGLPNTGRKKISEFSLGMKQRLSIAVALLHRPSLLILDEPTNGLDPNGIVAMRDLLIRLNREGGITIVISSHILAEIERLATHVGIIAHGKMIFQGTLTQLRHKRQQGVTLGTNDNARALRIISEEIPSTRIVGGKIALPPMSDRQIASVNRRLVESGMDVHELNSGGDDLEAIFMDMVKI